MKDIIKICDVNTVDLNQYKLYTFPYFYRKEKKIEQHTIYYNDIEFVKIYKMPN